MNTLNAVLDSLKAALQKLLGVLKLKQASMIQPQDPPLPEPVLPTPLPPAPAVDPDSLYPWDSSIDNNKHNVRALCDFAILTYVQKQLITALIEIESDFQNKHIGGILNGQPVKHDNVANGQITSTDWGIVQINDYFHIGQGKDFPTVQYVMDNPLQTVQFMIRMFKAGKISMWSSYVNLKNGSLPKIAAKYGIDVSTLA